MAEESSHRHYAHLPEDLIKKILEATPATVDKMNRMFAYEKKPVENAIKKLEDDGHIRKAAEDDFADSLIAVDGGNVIEKMSGADILLAVAVGVEGLAQAQGGGWTQDRNQYYQWQTILPHHEATPRLCQGVMFLMELSVLAGANYEVRIMDGAHFTPILKINSMLSAKEEKAGQEYAAALRDFLRRTYNKVIPDIPDMISDAFNDSRIVALAKYSSSRDILDAYVKDKAITLDDKTFFTIGLRGDDLYTKPLSVGQSNEERARWDDLHISCNLEIPEKEELNDLLENALEPIRTKSGKQAKESKLWFTYYKPYADGPAYRVECKEELARDTKKFERMLAGIKRQIVYPYIREPFPQYLADMMAKSVSGGLYALQDAIRLSPDLNIQDGRLDLLFPYRSR